MSTTEISNEQRAAERFTADTATHQMTVLLDQGLYRHLSFRRPGSSLYWFDLITVPGALVFQGDGDSYVFRRLQDMFAFFRSPLGEINPRYWSEKLSDGRGRVMVYSPEAFAQTVRQQTAAALRADRAPRGLTRAVREQILASAELDGEEHARSLADRFRFGGRFTAECVCGATADFTDDALVDAADRGERWLTRHRGPGHVTAVQQVEPFRFTDTWEWDLRGYDWWFLWACHAIVRGIAQYDAAHTPNAAPTPAKAAAA